jgi:hypothetical protein
MKLLSVTAALLFFAGAGFGSATAVSAAASDGVRCPNGFEAHYDVTQKVMRCERTTALHRPTVCDPASPAHIVYRPNKGRDYCVTATDAVLAVTAIPENDSRRRAVVCSADPADGLRWQIEVDAMGERDRCRATRSEWIYPSQQ